MENDYKKLETALYGVDKPSYDKLTKESIKKSVFNAIENNLIAEESSLRKLQAAIRKLSLKVVPGPVFKAKIKEAVFRVIDSMPAGPGIFRRTAWQMQKVLAALLLFTFAGGIVLVYVADIPVTKAAKRTFVQELAGDVQILRGNEVLNAYPGMELSEGDILITHESSIAEIRFFDDSVTRMSPFSSIKIETLYTDTISSTITRVDLELLHGRIWSQVVNLVDDDSSFNVKTTKIDTSATGKASFDVNQHADSKKTEVAVFQNKVQVSLPKKAENAPKMIIEGYAVEIESGHTQIEKMVIKPKITDDEIWITGNQVKDREYVEKVASEVKEEGRQAAGVLPDNPLYAAKKVNEGTRLFVAGKGSEKIKVQIDIAKKRLLEANALLADDKTEQAEALLNEFKSIFAEAAEAINTSDELREYVKSSLAEETKKLAVILPDSSLYKSKEALRDVKKQLAIGIDEQTTVALEQASEKMKEVKDLIADDKQETAAQTLKTVKEEVTNAVVVRKLNRLETAPEPVPAEHEPEIITDITEPALDETEPVENENNGGDSDIAVIIPVEPEEQE